MGKIVIIVSSVFVFTACKSDVKIKNNTKKTEDTNVEVVDSITINDTLKLTEETFYETKSFKKNSSAGEQYQKVMSHFRRDKGKLVYPAYYGGSYINEDNEYVIMLKGDVNQYKGTIFNILGNKDVILKSCKFSYRHLTAMMDKLNDIMQSKSFRNYTNYYIDETRNCIMMGLRPFDKKHINEFQQMVTNDPCIEFEEGDEIVLE